MGKIIDFTIGTLMIIVTGISIAVYQGLEISFLPQEILVYQISAILLAFILIVYSFRTKKYYKR